VGPCDNILSTSVQDPEYVKLVKLTMMQIVGKMKNEKYFFILAFTKSKLCNRLITHLPFVVQCLQNGSIFCKKIHW